MDIYDLYYLISIKKVNFDPDLINKKLNFYNIKFDKNEFIMKILKYSYGICT